jgi:serine/threonine-protein kinase
VSALLTTKAIDEDPGDHVRRHCTVIAEFGGATQDSGNVSWLVDTPQGRYFVKSAGPTRASDREPHIPVPYLDHGERVRLLRNAIELAASCAHVALPRLLNVIESPTGPALVYEAAPGDLVRVAPEQRGDPTSAYHRFAHLPADELLVLFDVLVDLHRDLAAAGWVAGDLYDGCLIVDFHGPSLRVIDLDSYRRGPSVNDMGRMFGSTRFMAPEEFEMGAVIDERTTTFTLGRLIWHFGTRLTEQERHFCGPPALARAVQRACQPKPADRHASVAEFAAAWEARRLLP